MKRMLFALALATASLGCSQRRVEVSSTDAGPAAVQLTVRNSLTQAVNVYVVNAGAETFLRQVAASATESIPVRGVAAGSTVTLRAVPADGRNSYTRENVTLTSSYEWPVP